jgi:hypothetical protein
MTRHIPQLTSNTVLRRTNNQSVPPDGPSMRPPKKEACVVPVARLGTLVDLCVVGQEARPVLAMI